MGTTPNYAIRYAELTGAADANALSRNLAMDVDALLKTLTDRVTALDTLVTSNSITPATGFTATSTLTRQGRLVSITATITRTGATISANATTGNVTNTTMATIPTGYRPRAGFSGPLATTASGPMAHGYVSDAGLLVFTAMSPSGKWNTSEVWSWAGVWFAA